MPTYHPHCTSIIFRNEQSRAVELKFFDVGSGPSARLVPDYFTGMHAVIFMVDVSERNHLVQKRRELKDLMTEPDLQGILFVVLGNKIDVPNSVSKQELLQSLD